MGFSIAWIGFPHSQAASTLRELNLHVTAELDPYMDKAPLSYGDMPGGWSIIFANDMDWVSEDKVRRLAVHRDVLAVWVEEHTDFWGTAYYSQGAPVWRVYRDTAQDDKLHVDGQLPAQYSHFVDAKAQQAWADGWAHFDPHKGLPVAEAIQVAEAITGFRHDRLDYPWGKAQFHVLATGFTDPVKAPTDQSM